jgi:hypothetical protein
VSGSGHVVTRRRREDVFRWSVSFCAGWMALESPPLRSMPPCSPGEWARHVHAFVPLHLRTSARNLWRSVGPGLFGLMMMLMHVPATLADHLGRKPLLVLAGNRLPQR